MLSVLFFCGAAGCRYQMKARRSEMRGPLPILRHFSEYKLFTVPVTPNKQIRPTVMDR